jgi:hypothetical protein
MLDILTSDVSLAILVSAVIFTLYGHGWGVSWGYKWYSEILINRLAREGYVRYRTLENGNIEIIKLNEDSQC